MEVNQKRQLLEDINLLVKRPAQVDETALARVLVNMTVLIQDLCQDDELILVITRQRKKGKQDE